MHLMSQVAITGRESGEKWVEIAIFKVKKTPFWARKQLTKLFFFMHKRSLTTRQQCNVDYRGLCIHLSCFALILVCLPAIFQQINRFLCKLLFLCKFMERLPPCNKLSSLLQILRLHTCLVRITDYDAVVFKADIMRVLSSKIRKMTKNANFSIFFDVYPRHAVLVP